MVTDDDGDDDNVMDITSIWLKLLLLVAGSEPQQNVLSAELQNSHDDVSDRSEDDDDNAAAGDVVDDDDDDDDNYQISSVGRSQARYLLHFS